MALTVKPGVGTPRFGPLRGQKARVFTLTADASKPAAGYTVLATDLGFTYLDFGVCGDPQANANYSAAVRIDTSSTKCTVQYYQNSASATNAATDIGTALGASVAALSTNAVPLYVIGR